MHTPQISKTNSAASTNATLVRAGAAQVFHIVATNINASIRYLKIYDKATAPTVGTDTPILTIPIPATGFANIPSTLSGIYFSLGLAFAITGAAADSDTTAIAAGDVKVVFSYY
jgi:hypothetical protein